MFLLCRLLTFLAVALEVYGDVNSHSISDQDETDSPSVLFGENTVDVSEHALLSVPRTYRS